MPPRFNFQMAKETKEILKSLNNILTVGELGFSAGIGADIVAKEARKNAPVKTGNLKRGIVSKINKRTAVFSDKGSAYVGANYKIAPHAHLVEFGARGGEMPAQPFMRPAIETKKHEAGQAIEADLLKRIKKRLS